MRLKEIQLKWIEKFREMQKADSKGILAAPFLSFRDESAAPANPGAILLIGKATAGCWHLNEFLSTMEADRGLAKIVEERRAITKTHLGYMENSPSSAFWRLWRALGKIGSPVIWTNLAKIGVIRGNPMGAYLSVQADLAFETLQAEVDEYKPSLIVIAGDYAKEQIVYRAFGDRAKWVVRGDGVCWIERTETSPALLWTDHPQGKKREVIRCWLEKAQELILQPH